MQPIVIISAMEEEAKEYQSIFLNLKQEPHAFLPIYKGKYNNQEIINIVSGIGKANSASATCFAIEKLNPKLIVNVGTCGGLTPCNIANIIVSNKAGYIDVNLEIFGYKKGQMANEKEYFTTYSNIENLLNKLKPFDFIKTGTVCTADSFISDQEKLKSGIEVYKDPICVEMEATAIAQVCSHYNKEAIFIKKVSDLADGNAGESFKQNVKLVNQNLLTTLKTVLENI